MNPKVSIICITFNQEKFIRKALDSFLMQETEFRIEVLVHDDDSTDGTPKIIKEYAKKYPQIIKPIFEQENQYKKGTFQFVNDMFTMAKGRYIAMCEGDDYWLDSKKLQKQVDFLEKNKDYSICFHNVEIFYEDGSQESQISQISSRAQGAHSLTISNLLKDNFIYTCSVMYRAQPYDTLVNSVLPQDLYLHLFHAKHGKIGFLNDVMARYRKQSNGVWWDSSKQMDNIYRKYRFQMTNLFSVLLTMFQDNRRYKTIINQHLNHLFISFTNIDKKYKTTLFKDTARDFPELVNRFVLYREELINELRVENRRLTDEIDTLFPLTQELEAVKSSHWYRLYSMKKR